MTLFHILVFTGFGLLAAAAPLRWRSWLLVGGSVLALFWLQPSTPLRNLDFFFPLVSIYLTILVWSLVCTPHPAENRWWAAWQPIWLLLAFIAGSVLLIALTRYSADWCCLGPDRPPEIWRVLLALLLGGGFALAPLTWRNLRTRTRLSRIVLWMIIGLLVALKTPALARLLSLGWRTANGQPPDLAGAADLPWLGFSYLAFRLLHALLDARAGRLPACTLNEFFIYVLFFPSLSAGPIERLQRFLPALRNPRHPTADDLFQGGWRILWGVFQKFVLADSLALIALNPQNAAQLRSTGWAWVVLYAYSLRIYCDFAGYTSVALGLARLLGLPLPENFDHPYLRSNLTIFWNNWHISLAQWFRAYFFNPLTRWLRLHALPVWLTILTGQLSMMLLIGLWHGVTWNFAAWGMWHGIGLFLHNRWNDLLRARDVPAALQNRPALQRLWTAGGWVLTFNYVSLGWVWFALPTPALAGQVFSRLFGIGG